MQFKDIVGQENVKNNLRQCIRNGHIPHAQMFIGVSGIGKLQLAIAYAQYLNCKHRTDQDSCGECPTCLQFQKLQHPDLHFVFPIVKSDSVTVCDDVIHKFRSLLLEKRYFDLQDWYAELGEEKKQGLIYEKESSEIMRKLSLRSFGDGYKTMIIWLPETMNNVCANKLLKIIEEPPQKTVILLVSEQPEKLLPTIISRVQHIRVPKIDDSAMAEYFTPEIAHMAHGSYLTAVKLQQQISNNQTHFKDFVQLMRNAWLVGKKKDYAALQNMKKWSMAMADSKREIQKAFLQYAQIQLRENYIKNFNKPEMVYQTKEENDFSARFAPFINDNNVEQIMDELGTAEQQISQNGNAKIIFFDLCLQMIILMK